MNVDEEITHKNLNATHRRVTVGTMEDDGRCNLSEAAERRRRRERVGEGVGEATDLETKQTKDHAFKLSYSTLRVGHISRTRIPYCQPKMEVEDERFTINSSRVHLIMK